MGVHGLTQEPRQEAITSFAFIAYANMNFA